MKSISLQNLQFSYSGQPDLFSGLSCVFSTNAKVALVGDNGSGKTTLLKLMAGVLEPDSGQIIKNASVYLLPQLNSHTTKSGGQVQMDAINRAFVSGANILLLDEPTNNLDSNARRHFYKMLRDWTGGAIVVSHDRELLNQMNTILELSNGKIMTFGGNYDFYVATKRAQMENISAQYTDTKKQIVSLTHSINVAQNTRQHHEFKQKKERNNARRSPIEANALVGKSQQTEARLRKNIQVKLDKQTEIMQNLSSQMRDDTIKIPMPSKTFYSKDLVRIEHMSFGYADNIIFFDFNFVLYGGQKLRIQGPNGSGKTTLLKLICGQLSPDAGTVKTFGKIAYLNQDLSLLDQNKTVVENIMEYAGCMQHDAHAIGANFGFRGDALNKRVGVLSGGELLRATLAAVLGSPEQPDLLILDEPTNNLDIKSVNILENAINQYRGAVLLVTHDEMFAKKLNITENMSL